jgi:hypothetical protein
VGMADFDVGDGVVTKQWLSSAPICATVSLLDHWCHGEIVSERRDGWAQKCCEGIGLSFKLHRMLVSEQIPSS